MENSLRDSDKNEVIRCPYCGSEEDCSHNLAVIDETFNECQGGYSYERFHEFHRVAEEYFLQQLCKGTPKVSGRRDKLIGELWTHAVDNYAPGDEEISLDRYVLTDLIINLLEGAGGQTRFFSEYGPPGFSSAMCMLYAKKPKIVFEAALAKLRARLKKAKLPKGKARRAMHVDKQVTDKPQRLLSKKEYDKEMQARVDRLKAEGKMPSLDEVLGVFRETLEKHRKRG
jgi:hypothetical protein